MSAITLFTVGHSNLAQPEFVALLRAWQLEVLIDIRAYPRSRRFTYFDADPLRDALGAAGITYKWAGHELGGMRKPARASPHLALDNGLRGYADHTGTTKFAEGVAQLLDLARVKMVTVMCAEKDPAHCHRALLSDYLVLRHSINVRHIVSAKETRPHELRPQARVVGDHIVYDRYAQAQLL